MKWRVDTNSKEWPWLILWHVLALALVLLAPAMVRLRLPYWDLPERLFPQVLALAVGYLATALFLEVSARRTHGIPLWGAVLGGGIAFAAPFLFLIQFVGQDYSRFVVASGLGLGLTLATVPRLISARSLRQGVVVLAFASIGTLVWAMRASLRISEVETAQTRDRSSVVIGTALHNVRITYHRGLVRRSPSSGGGLDTYRNGFIVANGVGEFHRLEWDGLSLASEKLELPPLLNRDRFLLDNSLEVEAGHFRIMDVLVDTISPRHRILASHYLWDPDERCLSMRVSTIAMPEGGGRSPGAAWEALFTARPCVPFDGGAYRLTNHSGGRMAWASDGALVLTLGEMAPLPGAIDREASFSQQLATDYPEAFFSQQLDTDYGKILVLDLQGEVDVLSVGHRNPEGLVVTRDGTIWSTEHGPEGGDELNLIMRGRNYGWPIVTYGTDGSTSWPPAAGLQDHGPYEEPVYAWLPSVGVSNLIELGGAQFPSWEGDLLIASLNGFSLFRTRIRSGRVVYTERIFIGQRIRDLVEDPQGRVLIWTDQSELVSLTDAGAERTGEVVYSECAVCHEQAQGGLETAPSLHRLFGREAGRLPGYDFSEAFQSLDLVWTPQTLDRFLSGPAGFVPGTTMVFGGLPEADREAVIEFLRTYE